MSTYHNHQEHVNGFSKLMQAAGNARDRYLRARSLRATETAIESLPEGIRHDIGWPDLYERHGSRSVN